MRRVEHFILMIPAGENRTPIFKLGTDRYNNNFCLCKAVIPRQDCQVVFINKRATKWHMIPNEFMRKGMKNVMAIQLITFEKRNEAIELELEIVDTRKR
mgnify:CR=1 FL=1